MRESADDHRHEYFIKLLDLVIAKSDIQYDTTRLKMQQGRAIIELTKDEGVDLIWSVTSIAREQQLLPIRIPLLKGLLGYRVLGSVDLSVCNAVALEKRWLSRHLM